MEKQAGGISTERFQELIAIEARMKALVDMATYQEYVSEEQMLCIIGTKEAIAELERREKAKSERKIQKEES